MDYKLKDMYVIYYQKFSSKTAKITGKSKGYGDQHEVAKSYTVY